jgi:hypothetical protein
MSSQLLNILGTNHTNINNQQLLDYLAGKLTAQEAHAIELLMTENEFLNDAIEGLQQIPDLPTIESHLQQINKRLDKKTKQKRSRRQAIGLKTFSDFIIALVLVLALIILSYYVLQYFY